MVIGASELKRLGMAAKPAVVVPNHMLEQFAREWLASEALRIAEDALTKNNNNIQAIVESNDGTAGGAISALPPDLVGKIVVTGQDAALDEPAGR